MTARMACHARQAGAGIAAALAVAFTVAAPADAARWSRPVTLSPANATVWQEPLAGVDGRGGVVASWAQAPVDRTGNMVGERSVVRVAISTDGRRFGRAHTFPDKPARIAGSEVARNGSAFVLYEIGPGCQILTCGMPARLSYRAPGKPFGKPERFTTSATSPAAGIDASGNVTVAWITPGVARARQVVVAERTARGRYTRPRVLSDTGALNLRFAVGPSGDGVAVWQEELSGRSSRRTVAAFRRSGRAWGKPERLSNGGGAAASQAALVNARGDALVGWNEQAGNTLRLRSAVRTRTERFGQPETVVDAPRNVRMALDSRGNAAALSHAVSCESCGFEFTFDPYLFFRPRGGTWGAGELVGPANGDARLTFDGRGVLHLLRGQSVESGGGEQPEASVRSRPPGGSLSAPVSLARANLVLAGDIAMNANGRGAAVWAQDAPVARARVSVFR